MVQLIVVLMGIALMSYLLVSGISYVDPSSLESKEKFERWSVLNLNLAVAWHRFESIKGVAPSSTSELEQMLSAAAPVPDDLHLSSLVKPFRGWCFQGQVSQAGYESLRALSLRFPDQYGLSSTCGTTGGIDPTWSAPDAAEAYPIPVVITYRLSR